MTIPLVINHQNAINSKDEDKSENMPEENQNQKQIRIYNQPKKYPQMKILKRINMKLMKQQQKINQMMKLTHQTLQKINHKTT